jgi:hypothetical protein
LPIAFIYLDTFIDWVLLFLILGSVGVIVYVIFLMILKPYIDLKTGEIPMPPEAGEKYYFLFSEAARSATFTVGKNMGEIPTKCSAISEGHLVFTFKKHPLNEEYDITVKRSGPTLFKPPRMQTYTVMESTEKLESHEVIGKTAEFRISGQLFKERMINYIEISLGSKFIFNKKGQERLQFVFTIERIHPGLNLQRSDGDGNFSFGKEEHKETAHSTVGIENID